MVLRHLLSWQKVDEEECLGRKAYWLSPSGL
ncbi:hypothetical protein T09_3738 [Trichinella sp. T9]|nr:hypothetical protein T09_3738 [Trichinella sp. T9]